MRAMRNMRVPAAAQIAAGALVLTVPPAAAAAVATTSTTSTTTRSASVSTAHRSSTHPGRTRARIALAPSAVAAIGGEPISIRGRLLPETRGRIVHLLSGTGHGWQQIAWTWTGPRGGFQLTAPAPAAGSAALKVVVTGNRDSRGASAAAGVVTSMQSTVASWYDDAGDTACGFHAFYGVANKTLPCGAKVTIAYGGHSVVATVDDRGPFVAGRTFDLNQNTAQALGMFGVATVQSSEV